MTQEVLNKFIFNFCSNGFCLTNRKKCRLV